MTRQILSNELSGGDRLIILNTQIYSIQINSKANVRARQNLDNHHKIQKKEGINRIKMTPPLTFFLD